MTKEEIEARALELAHGDPGTALKMLASDMEIVLQELERVELNNRRLASGAFTRTAKVI